MDESKLTEQQRSTAEALMKHHNNHINWFVETAAAASIDETRDVMLIVILKWQKVEGENKAIPSPDGIKGYRIRPDGTLVKPDRPHQ